MESTETIGRQEELFDEVPWLFYPVHSSGYGKLYNVIDGRSEERHMPYLFHADCLASAHGWLLLKNRRSSKLFLFNPSTSERLPLPRLGEEEEQLMYHVSSAPGTQDCFIVAVCVEHPYFLYSPPRGQRWEKYELNFDQNDFVLEVTSCNGKLYLLSSEDVLVVIDFAPRVMAQYLVTKKNDCCARGYDVIADLVTLSEDLFLVYRLCYPDTNPKIFRSVQVFKLNISLKIWESVESIKDSVFMVGFYHAQSFKAANTGLKRDCIYFFEEDALYCFDMNHRSLTFSYPFLDAYDGWSPFWLLDDKKHVIKQERNREREGNPVCKRNVPSSEERYYFDHPKFLPLHPSGGDHFLQQHTVLPMCCPPTPWLMFTHKDNGNYKFLDPFSKSAYEFQLPELLGSVILTSKDGWLIARVDSSAFFLNPFTKQRVDLPLIWQRLFGVAFTFPPTCPDCSVFCITSCDETKVTIYMHHFGDKEWTTREFENNIPFQLTHNNPVYHNGLFYCLGLNGDLGVYNPREETWTILRMSISLSYGAYKCSLVLSNGKLLSVFIDGVQEPIGVFEVDFARGRWKQVTDLGDRALFFSQAASYCVTAAVERMQSKIYLPYFQREYCLDLVVYPVATVYNYDACKKTEYLHIWIEPKGVVYNLDPARGRVYASRT